MKKKNLTILAIETSCDDTCVAIIKAEGRKKPHFKILSNIVSSQARIHKKYGGVYPFLAKREHQKNLPTVLKRALKKVGCPKINLIAVTIGPGLEPCLWTGINFARELAEKILPAGKAGKLPIVPINHIEAHIAANFIGGNSKSEVPNPKLFPAICLVVSGGHTQLILMNPVRNRKSSNGVKKFGQYKILGETRDDAAGECFDKVARILGLDYPGGPAVAAEAAKLKVESLKLKVSLPRPMIYQKNYDFSFSGLKTAVLYDFKSRAPKVRKSRAYIREMAKEIQQAIIDVLIHKTLKAAKIYKAKSIILGGGVVANKELRRQFRENCKLQMANCKLLVPDTKFCTDNAVMVAITGYFIWLVGKTKHLQTIEANANLRLE